MSLWTMPAELSRWFALLARRLDVRYQARFLALLGGVVFARGRRTVASWLRAAGVAEEFRPAYGLLGTVGRRVAGLATRLLLFVLRPLAQGPSRLLLAFPHCLFPPPQLSPSRPRPLPTAAPLRRFEEGR